MDICRFIILVATAMPIVAGATTYYVDNKLDDYAGHDGTSWELAYKRIQDAVAKAASGDTVLVARGTYGDDQGTVVDCGDPTNENYSYQPNRIWINDKHITIKSAEGAAVTHIVGRHADTDTGIGAGAVRCIAMSGTDNLPGTRIEGFTIRDGATVAYNTGSTTNGTGEAIKACSAAHRGGGLLFNYIGSTTHRNIHVVDCVISNCVAAEGAAAYGVVLLRCRVTGNNTHLVAGSATRQCNTANCIFDGNGAVDYEGTLYVANKDYPIASVNCTFFNNKGILRTSDAEFSATVFNAFIQCNGKSRAEADAYFAPPSWSNATFTNCVGDHAFACGNNNVVMSSAADNAQLVAPIHGDFRPVANPYVKNVVVGKGSKNYCSQDWIPSDDQNKDFFGNARWDGEDAVSAGAIQDAVDVAGGCIMLGYSKYSVDGRLFEGATNGYFYSAASPAQYRIKPLPAEGVEIYGVCLNGYLPAKWRHLGLDGSLVVTAPPSSSDEPLFLDVQEAAGVLWTDPNYGGGNSDGSESRPYATLQDAVDAAKDKYVVKAKAGRYGAKGKSFHGNSRVVVATNLCIRAVEGPGRTFIVGADGTSGNADGCGASAYRCVAIKSCMSSAVVGFTLTGGRTESNGESVASPKSANYRMAGGAFSDGQDEAQIIDCMITNCVGVMCSATYKCWLQNCRIVDCRTAANPQTTTGASSLRGVMKDSYLSGCVIGPNSYAVVSVDQGCILYNCTLNETSTTLHISKDAQLFNVLDLNNPTTQSAIGTTAGLCIETTSDLAHKNCVTFPDAKIVARGQGDFRPLQDSPVLVNGTTNSVPDFHRYTIGGIHGGLFPAGTPVVGASYDVATPVTVSDMRGVEISGGLGTLFVSRANPLTFTATMHDRRFRGFVVNGDLATSERTLVLNSEDDVASYAVEPLYSIAGLMIILR